MEFDELLEQAHQLIGVGDDNPQMYRTMSEVLQETQELHARVTQGGSKEIEANNLLSSVGIDLSRIIQKLDDLSIPKSFERFNTKEDFIQNETEIAKQSLIVRSKTILKLDDMKAEWAKEKTILLSSLVGPSQEFIDLESLPKQTVLDKKSVQRTQLNHIEASYAQAVIEYNETSGQGESCPKLVQKFANVAKGFYDDKLNEMWSILLHMVSVPPSSMNINPKKRYQEPEDFVTHVKSFLENHFTLYMSSEVVANMALEKCCGKPNIYNLIKAFVWVKFQGNNMIGLVDIDNGKPLWPHVYYSLRIGEMEIAIKFLQSFDYQNIELLQVIQDKIKHPCQEINSKLLAELNLLYSKQIQNTTDPFKKASFCLIGGFDLKKSHPEVVRTVEDFLWQQLYMVHNRQGITKYLDFKQFTFSGLQSLILEEYGESYFHASERPHTYFQALMLTGQFEAAIEFLARLEDYRSHAVHMALALNQLRALKTTRDVKSPLLYADYDDPPPMRRLNLARLIKMYAKGFQCRFTVTEALHYYSFLRKYKYSDGRDVFVTCVCDLSIKTLAFELIFGILDPAGNGQIQVGLLEQFTDLNCSTNTIAVMVAEQLVVRGMSESAVYLFDISGLHDKALKIINGLIYQCVKEFPHLSKMRSRLTNTVIFYKKRLKAHQLIIEPNTNTIATFTVLRKFLKFFNFYKTKKHERALNSLKSTKLIPNETSATDKCIDNIKLLSEEAYKVFPRVLVAVMNIYCDQYTKKKRTFKDSKDIEIQFDPILTELRIKAKALNCLATTIPNKMPDTIIKRLLQMGNIIN